MNPSRCTSLLAAAALALLAGCSGQHDDDDGSYRRGAFDDDNTFLTTIDSDYLVESSLGPGFEAGVWVEYQRGGFWTIETTCDTEELGYECLWDVYVTSERSEIGDIELVGTESETDFAEVYDPYEMAFFTTTAFENDVITFSADPGDFVTVEAILDGAAAPDFVVWSLDGQAVNQIDLRSGSLDRRITFQPDAP